MSNEYTAKTALVDLGFINGWLYADDLLEDDFLFESILDVLGKLEEYAIRGALKNEPADASAYAKFVYFVGKLRGLLWSHPTPVALSEAMERLIRFVTKNEKFPYQMLGYGYGAEDREEMLSEKSRDALLSGAERGEDTITAEFAAAHGLNLIGIICFWLQLGVIGFDEAEKLKAEAIAKAETGPQHIGEIEASQAPEAESRQEVALPPMPRFQGELVDEKEAESTTISPDAEAESPINPFNPSGKRGRREWTPEQRAAQAERAMGRKKPPFDDDLSAVKADFDAGMSLGAIAKKWGCSDSHVRNFLTRHGIDPRRNQPGARPPLTEDQVGTIISEKANGTSSKEIGEMIDRSQHEVDVKFSGLKRAAVVLDSSSEAVTEGDEAPEITPASAPEPSLLHRLTVAHPGYAGKREDSLLSVDDWAEIQDMLANGRTREAIAGDFDVTVAQLNRFVEDQLAIAQQRRAAKDSPPGEARAPL